MEYTFNKAVKKILVKTVEEVTGEKAKYLGVPSCAYQIGDYTVERDGTLKWDINLDRQKGDAYLSGSVVGACVRATGVTPKCLEQEHVEESAKDEDGGFTVEIPLEKVNTENLLKLLEAKGKLIKKALGVDNVEFIKTQESVIFTWFQGKDVKEDKILAYTKFISAICEMTMKQQRISAKEKEVTNEKYAFRCFLLRLGFIGKEYKSDRKILLKNLEGSSAFKNGNKEDET